MDQVRPRLEAFAAEMLGGLARSDQRAKGELYLRGLLVDGKRKSMQPMAARLGVDHQQLQQFVTSSTWDHIEVRKRVASWADEFIEPEAYVIDDSGFPKDGSDSPRVPQEPRQSHRSDELTFLGDPSTASQPRNTQEYRRKSSRLLAHRRMATRQSRTHRLLAIQPARRPPIARTGPTRQDPLADRTRLPRTQGRTRIRPLRRPQLHRLAPPRHPHRPGPSVLHTTAQRPKSPGAGLPLYAVLREPQTLLGIWTGACRTCQQPVPRHRPDLTDTT